MPLWCGSCSLVVAQVSTWVVPVSIPVLEKTSYTNWTAGSSITECKRLWTNQEPWNSVFIEKLIPTSQSHPLHLHATLCNHIRQVTCGTLSTSITRHPKNTAAKAFTFLHGRNGKVGDCCARIFTETFILDQTVALRRRCSGPTERNTPTGPGEADSVFTAVMLCTQTQSKLMENVWCWATKLPEFSFGFFFPTCIKSVFPISRYTKFKIFNKLELELYLELLTAVGLSL